MSPDEASRLQKGLLDVRGVKDHQGQCVTGPQCVLSVEHGVTWSLDSSATSMKAGVNSLDGCHANRL